MKLYSNCKLKAPNGSFLSFIDTNRAKWYLRKNLATVETEDPLVIKLNFEPKGPGNEGIEYFETPLESKCVVCGSVNNLTKHYSIPYSYRKFLPNVSHNNHDIIATCMNCHDKYERIAQDLKKELCKQYGVVFNKQPSSEIVHSRKAANTLLSFDLPDEKKRKLEAIVEKFIGKLPTEQDLYELCERKEKLDHSSELMAKITDYDTFAEVWRKHFIDTMNPLYMPKGWRINFKRL